MFNYVSTILIKEIFSLEASSYAKLNFHNSLEIRKYWKLSLDKYDLSKFTYEEIKNKIADLIPFGYTDTIGTKAFYARIHNEDKSVSSEIDVYFVTIPSVVDSICEDQGLSYPYGEYKQNPNLEENNFIWGAVYDTETEKLKHIKGYARFYN